MDTQLVLVHIHHCLLVQQFNIQLQHSANPLLPVNDEQDICNPTVNIILQLKCQLRSLSTYYQLQLHQYPLQVNFNFNINFHLSIKFNAKWMSDGHLTSMSNWYLNPFTGTREFFHMAKVLISRCEYWSHRHHVTEASSCRPRPFHSHTFHNLF